jgi:hypothetical protein
LLPRLRRVGQAGTDAYQGANMSGQTGETENCGNCRFILSQGSYFRCRRYPPVSDAASVRGDTHFPIVKTTDWCSEYDRGRDDAG